MKSNFLRLSFAGIIFSLALAVTLPPTFADDDGKGDDKKQDDQGNGKGDFTYKLRSLVSDLKGLA